MITIEVLDEQIAGYKSQYDQLQAALVKLEQDYASQKDLITATLHQVSGAAQGLEVLKGLVTPTASEEATNDVLAATPASNDDVIA